MEWWQAALLAATGIAAGFLNVIAGGGSLIAVPVMVFTGLPGEVANGSNRIAIIAQNASAAIAFFRRGYSEFRLSLTLAACAIPGAVAGAMIGVRLQGELFNQVLALVMIAAMVIMHVDTKGREASPGHQPNSRQLLWGHLLMVVAGFWGGFIQVGVGFILMPILNRVMGLDLVRTNMHKVAIILCYSLVAFAIFASQIKIAWIAGLALAIGNSVGGYFGAHFTIKKGEKLIRQVLNLMLIIFIFMLLFGG